MLVHLHVRNLALIEDIEVEFGPGLNILTGETGAGKSILLGSMQLILGGRSAKDMIRTGASSALVELLFQVENPRAEASLRELGVETSEGQVLLTRKLMDGRSINKINGETCTVAQMKAAASCLLDIHGQHEHQSLLYQDKQLEILDIYGKEEIFPAKDQVQKSYKEYRDCKRHFPSFFFHIFLLFSFSSHLRHDFFCHYFFILFPHFLSSFLQKSHNRRLHPARTHV